MADFCANEMQLLYHVSWIVRVLTIYIGIVHKKTFFFARFLFYSKLCDFLEENTYSCFKQSKSLTEKGIATSVFFGEIIFHEKK